MEEELVRVIYVSKTAPTLEDHALSDEITGILTASRRNNPACGITGALIFNHRFFGQVLEGPPGSVEDTFERIQMDPRHRDVTVLSYAPVGVRSFPDWSMGYVGADTPAAQKFGTAALSLSRNLERMDTDIIYKQLHDLAMRSDVAIA